MHRLFLIHGLLKKLAESEKQVPSVKCFADNIRNYAIYVSLLVAQWLAAEFLDHWCLQNDLPIIRKVIGTAGLLGVGGVCFLIAANVYQSFAIIDALIAFIKRETSASPKDFEWLRAAIGCTLIGVVASIPLALFVAARQYMVR